MRFAFTEDQLLFRQTLRDALQKECTPARVRAAWHNSNGRIDGLWAQLAEMGIVGLLVPEAHGGLSMNEIDIITLLEEAGRAALPEPLLETAVVAATLLRDAAPVDVQAEWLPKIASGEATVTVGIAPSPFVMYADSADLMLLQHDGEIHAVKPADTKLTAEKSVDFSRRLFKVNWTPSKATLVSGGAAAQQALAAARDRGALAAAAQLVGISQQLLDMSVEYAKVRKQFNVPIGSFQAVKHHLANAVVKVEFARPLVYRAAYSMAHNLDERHLHVAMAKSAASDALQFVAKVALQCHGAIGYTFEYDLHLWMKRGWALAAAWGDAAHHRARMADALIDGKDFHREAGRFVSVL